MRKILLIAGMHCKIVVYNIFDSCMQVVSFFLLRIYHSLQKPIVCDAWVISECVVLNLWVLQCQMVVYMTVVFPPVDTLSAGLHYWCGYFHQLCLLTFDSWNANVRTK